MTVLRARSCVCVCDSSESARVCVCLCVLWTNNGSDFRYGIAKIGFADFCRMVCHETSTVHCTCAKIPPGLRCRTFAQADRHFCSQPLSRKNLSVAGDGFVVRAYWFFDWDARRPILEVKRYWRPSMQKQFFDRELLTWLEMRQNKSKQTVQCTAGIVV